MKVVKFKKAMAAFMVSAMTISSFAIPARATVTNDNAVMPTSSYEEESQQRKIIGYFPEWAIDIEEQGNFSAVDLQWDYLTHIQYSFMGVGPDNKIAFLNEANRKNAIERDFSEHKLMHKGKEIKMDPTLPYKGHFNVLQTMKKQYPDVKLVMSVGGWGASTGFYEMLDTDAGINTFADSCVEFVRKYNFDGIDIDFEYPTATSTAGNPKDLHLSEPRRPILNARYNLMMKTLREKLDAAEREDKRDYVLAAAVAASAWILGGMDDNSYTQYLDFTSVMSYDFHGGWNHYVENLANIYPDPADTETIQMAMPTLCMDWAYRYFRGVLPSEKILMGIPYYTRGWEGVTGGTNGLHGTAGSAQGSTPAQGPDSIYNIWGDDDDGDGVKDPAGANPLWHVKNLMDQDPNFKRFWDDVGKVPYVWNDKEKVFLSFEDEQSIDERIKYVKDKNLGGALIWVMTGDFGPNPNYVPGSRKITEGKYFFGDTLTKRLSEGFKAIGDYKISDERPAGETIPEPGDFIVETSMKYDHPNGEMSIKVKGINGYTVPKGWVVEFDMPKSAIYTNTENAAQVEVVSEDEVFVRLRVTSSQWSEHVVVKSKLCYSGLRNIRINGKVPANLPVNGNFLPTISGVSDKRLTVGAAFDKMAGVTADDKEDGNLTSAIRCANGVNTKEAGVYRLEYIVKDSSGMEAIKRSTVYVLPQEYANVPLWDGSTQYAMGDLVLYQGTIYEGNSWWIPAGTLPTNSTHFKLVEKFEDKTFTEGNVDPIYAKEDVNKDGVVNITDLSLVSKAYNAKKGQAAYKAEYDLNADGIIDLFDIVAVGKAIK